MGIKTYVVKKGDTLSAIARDHIGEASQYKEIAKINGINNTEMINVGDVLKIPVPSEGKVETLDLDEISKESSQPGESNKEKGNTITQKPYNAQNPYMQKKETPKEDAIQEKSIMQKEYQASNPYIQKQEEGKTEFLKNYGFGEEDIKRIERGEIEVEELIKEVNEDKNPERRKKLMEKGYLMMYGQSTELDITDMEELKKAYEKVKVGLKESREELKEIERENSGVTEQVLKKIEEGKTLEEILKSQVAWRYKDKEGNVKYIYNTPTQISAAAAASGVNDGRKYEAVYGSEIGEEEIESLKQVLSNGNSYKGSDQEKEALRKIKEKSIEKEKNKEKRKKDLEDKIGWLEEKHGLYKDVIEKVEYEVDYYFTYQDRYVLKEDFNNQNKIKGEVREKAKELFDVSKYRLDEKTGETKHEGYGNVKLEGDGSYTVNDKEAVVALISSIINETGEVEYDGTLKVGGENGHVITSGDLLLTNYGQWLAYMSETEKGIFNYILNTEGYEKAYKYLDDVAYYFDNKWVEERSKKDEEFADNHGVLASLASAASGWVGGAEAFFHSTYSAIQGQKIRKTNTYNPMDTYRSKVSLNIREKSEELAFLYDTGMSMADSGMMMALTAGMGTAGRAATSTLLMGSRAYVSTLNENLDRGLSDGEAILTAIASAATDAAMEAYSAGHLMNLEEKLGEGAMRAVDAAGRATKNEAVNEILQKGTYVLMSAGSQGITEAEEEMTTEIVNELIDRGVIKDKSQYEERIKWYQELGYTENESKGKANVEFINRVKQASLGGLLSGVTFGAVGGALNVKGGALDGSRVEVGKVGREDVETVQTKIENDVSVKEESNVNHNVDSKVKTSVEADLKRYNEIMDIMKTEEYQEYKYNYEHGYAQVLREDFNKIEAELKVLEKRLGDHIPKQASQTEKVKVDSDQMQKTKIKTPSELDLDRYNEIMDIMKSDDYQIYKTNPSASQYRAQWVNLENEYQNLVSKLSQHASQNNQNQTIQKETTNKQPIEKNQAGAFDYKQTNSMNSKDAKALLKNIGSKIQENLLHKIKHPKTQDNRTTSYVQTSVEADLKRYNEIMDIMKTEEYQEYKYNYEHGYAQVLREDFNKIEAELKVLEKRLGDHISKQASQANISTANIPRNYVSFSKNFIESIDQMSQYYGDAGYTVNSLFLKGNTIQQIFSQLDRQSQMDFYNFLQNTREGRYLASLSADEIRSLCIYTWGSYRTINEKLRSEKISGKINGIEAQTLVNNMDSAIAKFGGLETPMELYRAVDVKSFTSQNSTYKALFEGIDITDLNQVYSVLKVLEGKEFGDLGYMSASPGYSTSFAKQDDYPIVLDIIADKGTPGAYINQISTFYNGENEFLLAHGMKLEMLEVSPPQRDINGLEKIIVKCVVK